MKNNPMSKIKKVSIFYNPDIHGVASLVQNIQNDYTSKFDKLEPVPLIVDKENKLINENEKKLIASDLIICVGGDGTVLRLAQSIVNKSIPIFGIRMGRLGFLTESTSQEVNEKINSIINGDFYIEERKLVKAEYDKKTYFALNDFVIGRKNLGRTSSIGVWINEMPIAEYRSDAVIAASATGSTGYTLSIGGPVLMPSSESIIIMPLAPHLTPSNPIILPSGDEVVFQVLRDNDAIMIIDGISELKVDKEKHIKISISRSSISFLRINNSYNFLNRVADRLGWLRQDHTLGK
ncbi:MAG: NAD(+)/NADH kinase [Dehalococcoidia bacterium]